MAHIQLNLLLLFPASLTAAASWVNFNLLVATALYNMSPKQARFFTDTIVEDEEQEFSKEDRQQKCASEFGF